MQFLLSLQAMHRKLFSVVVIIIFIIISFNMYNSFIFPLSKIAANCERIHRTGRFEAGFNKFCLFNFCEIFTVLF